MIGCINGVIKKIAEYGSEILCGKIFKGVGADVCLKAYI